jgi:hypothetical protein
MGAPDAGQPSLSNRRWRLAVTAFLCAASVCVLGWSVFGFWNQEASSFQAAAAKRELDRKCARVVSAQRQLESQGAQFWQGKGRVFNEIDLTTWQGDGSDLEVLKQFVLLEDLGHRYEYTCGHCDRQWVHINAQGSPVSDAAVPRFLQVRNLRYLDIRGSRISDEGHRRLRGGLPECEILR